jgi:hypothetical protein
VLAELRAGVKQAERDLMQSRKDAQMLVDLDEARMARGIWNGRSFNRAASNAKYAKACSTYGLDVSGPRPASAALALRKLPPEMRRPLVVALDDWSGSKTAPAPNCEWGGQ